jgi:hypothetical protein
LPASQCARFCSFHTTVRQGLRGCVSHPASLRAARATHRLAGLPSPGRLECFMGRAAQLRKKAAAWAMAACIASTRRRLLHARAARRAAKGWGGAAEGQQGPGAPWRVRACSARTQAGRGGQGASVLGLASAVGPLASAACCCIATLHASANRASSSTVQ